MRASSPYPFGDEDLSVQWRTRPTGRFQPLLGINEEGRVTRLALETALRVDPHVFPAANYSTGAPGTSNPYLLNSSAVAAVLTSDKNCRAACLFFDAARMTQACSMAG